MSINIEKILGLLKDEREVLRDPVSRLIALAEHCSSHAVFTTSFGLEDQMITDIIAREKLPFSIVTLDTGRFFPETYDVWQRTEERYAIRIKAYYPHSERLTALVADQGINGFYYSSQMRKACCAIRKIEPLERATRGALAWITGLRRDQSKMRETVTFVLHDTDRNLLKVNPLYDLTRDAISAYTKKRDVPINSLHQAGFLSIGCAPCTRPVQKDEDERSGRWWWEKESLKECGLHTKREKDSSHFI
ncbi:MAG: phosphoadenosine phosphosulfate reductase [Candidatus Tokpelaia sp. JSC161]|jgi:phosphoadenosine phosphosulfate reductase|nr:MAG: phosphoadenosine phosphosulfate reductase [Candidatus Tokpelaia sp. JSC161]